MEGPGLGEQERGTIRPSHALCRRRRETLVVATQARSSGRDSGGGEKGFLRSGGAHRETNARLEMDDRESVVASARSGDWYRFMRRVGGDGGHELIVRGFRAVAMLDN